jgi:hypothetical protein
MKGENMFKVRDIGRPEDILTVYAVDYCDESDDTFFLLFDERTEDWEWSNAKYYEPV